MRYENEPRLADHCREGFLSASAPRLPQSRVLTRQDGPGHPLRPARRLVDADPVRGARTAVLTSLQACSTSSAQDLIGRGIGISETDDAGEPVPHALSPSSIDGGSRPFYVPVAVPSLSCRNVHWDYVTIRHDWLTSMAEVRINSSISYLAVDSQNGGDPLRTIVWFTKIAKAQGVGARDSRRIRQTHVNRYKAFGPYHQAGKSHLPDHVTRDRALEMQLVAALPTMDLS